MNKIDEWVKSCLRKKKLQEFMADEIINRANTPLRKYYCPHCFHWHVAKKLNKEENAQDKVCENPLHNHSVDTIGRCPHCNKRIKIQQTEG